jgi:hypothetical protein
MTTSSIFDFDKFMFFENNEIIVKVKFFKRQKEYSVFITFIKNFIEETIENNIKLLNTNKLSISVYLKGYKINELDYGFIKHIISILENEYPDNLDIIRVFNMNIILRGVYTILKPFINKETRGKIFFCKGNEPTNCMF